MKLKPIISAVAVAMILSAGLTACGGGGGGTGTSDVVVPVKGAPLVVSAASAISLQSGDTTKYKISGGGGGSAFATYTASSSNPNAATVTLNGNDLIVTGKGAGTGNIVVVDNASNTVSFGFTVTPASSPLAFKVNIPSPLNLDVNGVGSYDIIGGVLPYTVASSTPGVVNATVNGSKLTVLGIAQGTGNVAIFDGTGATITVSTLIGGGDKKPSALFSTAPSAVTIKPGSNGSYLIGGGIPPYVAVAANNAVVSTSFTNSLLTVTGLSAGVSDVVVTDSIGTNLKITATVSSGPVKAFFSTAPQTVIITPSAGGSYTINGGTPPYTATSSNATIISSTISGSTLNISGNASGSGNVVVFDANGQTIQIQVIVASGIAPLASTAPSAITLKAPEVGTYDISGGKGPYTAVSSNTTVATASVSGTSLTISSKAVGTASIVIRDASGSVVSTTVTVN